MSPRTKAVLKTTGIVLAGAATFAYLPLVSFAVAPQVVSWIHLGLAAFHPLLGEALLGGSCLLGMGMALKKTWKNYFVEKKLEQKIEKIVEQKIAHPKSDLSRQRESAKTKQIQNLDDKECKEVEQRTAALETSQKKKIVRHSDEKLKWKVLGIFRGRKNYRDAA